MEGWARPPCGSTTGKHRTKTNISPLKNEDSLQWESMRRTVTGLLMLLLAMPGLPAVSTGGGVHSFEGGQGETVCTLKAPGLLGRVNVILPEKCLVITVTFRLAHMYLVALHHTHR